ncbi:MAG: UDP-N-acetylmuramoyl-tripeptide--D-alanyl-D-alanine ligase [Kiritimatiellia bacterium]|jgi:UDP-N-acetylmuramoyl-tripeptide--D-alanyl-D-alanine ligase
MTLYPSDLARWTRGSWRVPVGTVLPESLSGVSNNSSAVPVGGLYVAIRGARLDGHAFVADAAAHGAAAALVARDWEGAASARIPLLEVDDPVLALSDAAAGWRRAVDPFVVGVTGSAGKTTVKELAASMLGGAAPTARTFGNFNNAVGLPLSLLAMPEDSRFGVFEIGTSHPGELAPLARILAPDAAIVSSVGPVHIENYPNLDAIADEKATLPRGVPPEGFAVLEAGAPYTARIASQCACRIVLVGLECPGTDFNGVEMDGIEGSVRVIERGGEPAGHRLHHGLPGRHQALNCLMACAAARRAGASWEAIQLGLKSLALPGMRWERSCVQGIHVVNDAYNANPISMACAIDAFATETAPSGRRWLALGDMLELGDTAESAHRALGAKIAEAPWAGLVAVGPLSAWTADEARIRGFRGAILSVPTAAEAGPILRSRLAPGDALLLKASRGIGLEIILDALR